MSYDILPLNRYATEECRIEVIDAYIVKYIHVKMPRDVFLTLEQFPSNNIKYFNRAFSFHLDDTLTRGRKCKRNEFLGVLIRICFR